MVDSEIEDNLRVLQQSPPIMSDEEKAKLEVKYYTKHLLNFDEFSQMINELRFILEEPELESPRSLNASVPGERHESETRQRFDHFDWLKILNLNLQIERILNRF